MVTEETTIKPVIAEMYFKGYRAMVRKIFDVPAEPHCKRKRQRPVVTPSETISRLIKHAMWPSEVRYWTLDSVDEMKPKRAERRNDEHKGGTFFSEKVKREVEFGSQLERAFYRKIEEAGDVIWYIERPFEVRYTEDDQEKSYVPDALLWLRDNRFLVVEIKPVTFMSGNHNMTKWCALSEFCNAAGWGILITDGVYSITELERFVVNVDFACAVLSALSQGPLNWPQYKSIKEQFGASRKELHALVYKRELNMTVNPFSLSLR